MKTGLHPCFFPPRHLPPVLQKLQKITLSWKTIKHNIVTS